MKFMITFRQGLKVIARVEGERDVDPTHIAVQDVGEQLINAEQLLEKLTGYRVHIEQAS